jgi:hypothetical protein
MSENVLPLERRDSEADRKRILQECRGKWTQTDVAAFEVGGLFFVMRGPTREEFKRFRIQVVTPASRAAAQEVLVLECTLHPGQEAMDALLNRKPGLMDPLGEALMQLAQGGEGAQKKDW